MKRQSISSKNGKIARWANRLSEYRFTVQYVRGSQLTHVDYFSRFIDDDPDPDLQDQMVYKIQLARYDIVTLEDIFDEQKRCTPPAMKEIYQEDGIVYYNSRYWVAP